MTHRVDDFHCLYFETPEQTWGNTHYMGVPTAKCPLDLWIYQEIIHETKPELIIETGTFQGGSALFLYHTMLAADIDGWVISIDIRNDDVRAHSDLHYIVGDSADPEIAADVKRIAGKQRTMVILDSDHSQEHVAKELELYAPLVSPGCYLIVEDTNVNGHPVAEEHGPGPMEAVAEFITSDAGAEFRVDKTREKFYLTFNPNGYLLRVG